MSDFIGPKVQQIIIIASAGRKRENLITLAASAGKNILIQSAETCTEVEGPAQPNLTTLILIDHRNPALCRIEEVQSLQECKPGSYIVLLRSRLRQMSPLSGLLLREVLYDDISEKLLLQLMEEARLGDVLVQTPSCSNH